MENTNVQEVKMPITYDDLKKSLVDSGRPYDFAMIDRAYALAEKAHGEQRRRSGEPYICHPLSVAQILVELGMDSESIAAALMHDVAEDTPVTVAEIKQKFGPEVALLVDGVTKLTQIKFSNVEDRQAENLRKMLLAMSQDVRVMIIKLCDRLHNMRTGDAWPEQKRRDKALETMEVYAPIAHRLGISNIKEELEDRSLHYLDPVGYETIRDLLNKHGDEFLHQVCHTIARHLSENGIQKATIRHRVKSIYGIYRKMYMQNKDFEEIYDIYAVRIILDNVPECYTALGLIHDMYHPLPNRFKDYISTPKPNGYQSLHTTVIGREAIPFEVQIRTWDMDRMAEYGIAAHWKYKAGITGSSDKLDERLAWVRQLLESQRSSADATDLLSDIKSDLLPEEVFAFTPRGDVINLPAGATAIDFAYAIHSAVGNRMIGAKVNNRIVPIDHKVQTGEIIEIITGSENRGPSRDWLNIVKTSEAKNKIRNWFKKERREENIQEGRDALEREMRRNLMTLTDEQHDVFMEALARRNRCNSVEEMYAAIGYGGLQISRMLPKLKEEYTKLQATEPKPVTVELKRMHSSDGVIVEGIDNCPIKFAKCCSPLPGDEIIGFVTRGFGVSIHKRDCANARESMRHPENADRWVRAYWDEAEKENYKATLDIVCMDRANLVSDVALALGDMRVPIYSLTARAAEQGRAPHGRDRRHHQHRAPEQRRGKTEKDQGRCERDEELKRPEACRGRTCAARNCMADVRLPFTAGPGMPGPYSAADFEKEQLPMRAVIQRVTRASVTVNGGEPRAIGPGLVILLGVRDTDDSAIVPKLAEKCAHLRIFEDEDGKLNRSAVELGYSALVVSNFTLYGDTSRGKRPSFIHAAKGELAVPCYEKFLEEMSHQGLKDLQHGEFGADMKIDLVNDGPVTIVIDTDEWKK